MELGCLFEDIVTIELVKLALVKNLDLYLLIHQAVGVLDASNDIFVIKSLNFLFIIIELCCEYNRPIDLINGKLCSSTGNGKFQEVILVPENLPAFHLQLSILDAERLN